MRKAKRSPKGEGLTVRKRKAKAFQAQHKRSEEVADRIERKAQNKPAHYYYYEDRDND